MDQQTGASLVSTIIPLIAPIMSIIAAVASLYTAFNVKKIEREKSKLKKAEIIFSMQVEALREFNKIYYSFVPNNLSETHDWFNFKKEEWIDIRSKVSKFQENYTFLFNDEKIIYLLEEIMRKLVFVTNEDTYQAIKRSSKELDKYLDIYALIAYINKLIKEYVENELKKE